MSTNTYLQNTYQPYYDISQYEFKDCRQYEPIELHQYNETFISTNCNKN
jgi:hypothetical protein